MFNPNDPSVISPFEGRGLSPQDRKVNINAHNGTMQAVRITGDDIQGGEITSGNMNVNGHLVVLGTIRDTTGNITSERPFTEVIMQPADPAIYLTDRSGKTVFIDQTIAGGYVVLPTGFTGFKITIVNVSGITINITGAGPDGPVNVTLISLAKADIWYSSNHGWGILLTPITFDRGTP